MKIALMAYARSGKDSVYEIIRDYSEATSRGIVARLAFGDALRKYAHEITDVPTEPKPRWLYEKFGKFMRMIDKDVWVKQLDKTYKQAMQLGLENFVITDLRQPNEYKWAKENGFNIVFIECDESIRKERSQSDSNWVAVNPSETEIANLASDYVIKNNGSLDALIKETIDLIGRVEKCTEES